MIVPVQILDRYPYCTEKYIADIESLPTWGPPGSCRSQMGPILAPRTLLSGMVPHWLRDSIIESMKQPSKAWDADQSTLYTQHRYLPDISGFLLRDIAVIQPSSRQVKKSKYLKFESCGGTLPCPFLLDSSS